MKDRNERISRPWWKINRRLIKNILSKDHSIFRLISKPPLCLFVLAGADSTALPSVQTQMAQIRRDRNKRNCRWQRWQDKNPAAHMARRDRWDSLWPMFDFGGDARPSVRLCGLFADEINKESEAIPRPQETGERATGTGGFYGNLNHDAGRMNKYIFPANGAYRNTGNSKTCYK